MAAARSSTRRSVAIRLFGNVEIVADGEPHRLVTPRKTLQILTYLLLNRETPVAREYLSFLLWPDDEETSARTKLRASLRDLQAMLPQPAADFVLLSGERLSWNPDATLWLDVEAFEAAAADRTRAREAVDLYRGDLVPELYEEWLYAPREHYRNAYLRCLSILTTDARARGAFDLAIDSARKILAVDPWREDVVRRIIDIRNDAGDRAGALSEYAKFRERLQAEMGIDPMPETTALAERIARGAPSHGAETDAGGPPPAAAGRGAGPMAGRENELERLVQAWTRAKQGRGGIVFLGGEPGVGKSRLALELMRAVEDDGGRVLAGATGMPESFPFQSLVEALRSGLPMIAALRLSPTWFAAIASLVPELPQRVGELPALPALDPERQSLRLFEAMTRAIVELAKARPLLLVLEDLHWASDSTFAALDFLARQGVAARVVVLVTFRNDEAHRRHPLRRLQRETELHGAASSISLPPLDLAAVTAIVQAQAAEAGDEFAAAMHARSGGNPLFLGQLLAAPRDVAICALPPTIASLIEPRLAALSEPARTFAEIAAVVGDRFSVDVVRDVAGWDDAAATRAVDELIDRRIIRETTGRGIFRYAFAHQLVQQTILDAAETSTFRDRSRRTARALRDLYPERIQELAPDIARHFATGDDATAAAEHYLIAALRSIDIGSAPAETMHFVTEGLALAQSRATAGRFLLIRERLYERAGDTDAQWTDLDTLLDIANETAEDELLRTTLQRRMRFAGHRAEAAALTIVDEMQRRAVETGDPRWEADAALARGNLIEIGVSIEDALIETHRAGELYAQIGDDEGRVRALSAHVRNLLELGRFQEARTIIDEAVALATRLGKYESLKTALYEASRLAIAMGDHERLEEVSRRRLDLTIAAGDRPGEMQELSHAAWLLADSPSFAQSLDLLQRAGAIARDCNMLRHNAMIDGNLGRVYVKLGAFAAARAALERAVAFLSVAHPNFAADVSIPLVLALAFDGDPERAAAVGRETLATLEAGGKTKTALETLEYLAEAEWLCGRRDNARDYFETALATRRRIVPPTSLSKVNGMLAALCAETADLKAAAAYADAVIDDEAGTADDELWPQRTAWATAFAHRACADDVKAQRWLERARALHEKYAAHLTREQRSAFDALPWHRAAAAAQTETWPATFW
jgi:DNA-binding SARP family transcriptional activator